MKKHFVKIGIAAMVLSVAAVNVHLNSNNESGDVTLSEVEALSAEWNDLNQWITQGFTKDEREVEVDCQKSNSSWSITIGINIPGMPVGAGITFGGSSTSATKSIKCGSGNVNCSSTSC